nr:MAG TPA: hypothetical protein [Caudoviricetes sp.]
MHTLKFRSENMYKKASLHLCNPTKFNVIYIFVI